MVSVALSAAHAPRLPLSEERPDPGGCSPEPASLARTVGKPWVRTRVHLGLGKEGGGVGRNGCHVLGNAQLSLAASPASRPGQILPTLVSLGQKMCAKAMVVLGLAHGDAGTGLGWCWRLASVLEHSPKSGIVHVWGCSRQVWGAALCRLRAHPLQCNDPP